MAASLNESVANLLLPWSKTTTFPHPFITRTDSSQRSFLLRIRKLPDRVLIASPGTGITLCGE